MPSRVLDRQRCLKRGCILTCYVDGRKRFRAFAADFVSPGEKAAQVAVRPASHPADRALGGNA